MDKNTEYIPLEKCVDGNLYLLDARNFNIGVFFQKESLFIGIRTKFGSRFLDIEFHWDTGPPYGTVIPLELLYENTGFTSNDLYGYFPYGDAKYMDIFDYLKAKEKEFEHKWNDS